MRKKVLICDDEEGIRESLKLILENSYDLSFSQNGKDAIEKSKKEFFDFVILDIKMPKISGLETLAELKKISPKTKIIIVSGYKSFEIAQEAIRHGASDYIIKPFESATILRSIEKLHIALR